MWVLPVEYRKLNSSGDSVVIRTTLGSDSENMFCISTRRFWTKFTHFHFDVDSNPEVVLSRSHAERRSVLSCCLRCLEIGNFMHKLHVAGSVHDEG